jgi:hypothetical protein
MGSFCRLANAIGANLEPMRDAHGIFLRATACRAPATHEAGGRDERRRNVLRDPPAVRAQFALWPFADNVKGGATEERF